MITILFEGGWLDGHSCEVSEENVRDEFRGPLTLPSYNMVLRKVTPGGREIYRLRCRSAKIAEYVFDRREMEPLKLPEGGCE